MEAFLKGLYAALPSWARVLVDPIVVRLLGIYNWIYGILRAVIPNWHSIVTGARLLRQGVADLGFQTLTTLRWLRNVWIPRLASAARDAAIRALVAFVGRVIAPIVAAAANLRAWVLARLADAINGLGVLNRWATAAVRALIARALALERRVFGLWLTPGRLAAWLVGAMWGALWHYGWDQVERITEYFWRRRQAILLRGVAEIERQIGRIL